MRFELPGIRVISAVPVARLARLALFSLLDVSDRAVERLFRELVSSAASSFGGVVFLPEMKPPAAPSTKVAAGRIQGFFMVVNLGKGWNPDGRKGLPEILKIFPHRRVAAAIEASSFHPSLATRLSEVCKPGIQSPSRAS